VHIDGYADAPAALGRDRPDWAWRIVGKRAILQPDRLGIHPGRIPGAAGDRAAMARPHAVGYSPPARRFRRKPAAAEGGR